VQFELQQIVINSAPLFVPPRGDVWQWCEGIKRELKKFAVAFAPPNRSRAARGRIYATGDLVRQIDSAVTIEGAERLDIWVWSGGPHAKYVLGGTASQGTRYIYSTAGYANRKVIAQWFKQRQIGGIRETIGQGLVMGPLPPGPGNAYQLRVHGQVANPYLQDAYTVVQSGHRSLPPKRFQRSGLADWG
jgi:hypothetical protein